MILPAPNVPEPNLDHIVTEDETPVDNIFSEIEQKLLTSTLYASWTGPGEGRSFVTMSNVGMFFSLQEPPLVPDALLSLDVQPPPNVREKKYRSYFYHIIGKAPEVVIEIVSNREGNEDSSKLSDYARAGVQYYVIHDPDLMLGTEVVRVFELRDDAYVRKTDRFFQEVGLGLTLWQGELDRVNATWLRWCDAKGNLIPTGAERAERLAAKLRALGQDPDA